MWHNYYMYREWAHTTPICSSVFFHHLSDWTTAVAAYSILQTTTSVGVELLWLCCTHEDENLCIVESFVNMAEEVWKIRLSDVAMKCAVLNRKLSGGFLIKNYTYTITIYYFSNSDGHLWLSGCSKLKHSMRSCVVFHTIRWINSSSSYFSWSSASPLHGSYPAV